MSGAEEENGRGKKKEKKEEEEEKTHAEAQSSRRREEKRRELITHAACSHRHHPRASSGSGFPYSSSLCELRASACNVPSLARSSGVDHAAESGGSPVADMGRLDHASGSAAEAFVVERTPTTQDFV